MSVPVRTRAHRRSDHFANVHKASAELRAFRGVEGAAGVDGEQHGFDQRLEGPSPSRFAGRGGLSYSGTIDGRSFDMAVTPAECSDGMSDRTYPFVVTLRIGGAPGRLTAQ